MKKIITRKAAKYSKCYAKQKVRENGQNQQVSVDSSFITYLFVRHIDFIIVISQNLIQRN